MKPDGEPLNTLLARLVEETITPEEVEQLEAILDKDPEAQSYYLRYLGLHNDLEESDADLTRYGHRPNPVTSGANRVWSVLAAAAVAITGFVLLLLRPEPTFVTLVDFGGAVQVTASTDTATKQAKPGQKLGNSWIETSGGDAWAELEFDDGSRIHLSGMAKLLVKKQGGQKELKLSSGSLSVDAKPQPKGKPMRVITASAEAEVLGTQFNVQTNSFLTQLEVNEGLVKVKRLSDGSVEEVKPDYEVVAALEAGTAFVAKRREAFATSWQSEFPRDLLQGQYLGKSRVKAKAHLWKGDSKLNEKLKDPVLLHTITVDPSTRSLPRVKLQPGHKVSVKGRVLEPARLHIGFGANHWNGGFFGKYAKFIPVESEFEIEIPLADLKPLRSGFPESPVSAELTYLWFQTVRKDMGLEIESVRILQ